MQRNKGAGFSLIELLVAIAIVAILLAVAFPSFEDSMRRNRLATTTNELLGSVSLARSEAIRNTRGGGICASEDGLTCGDDWNKGWLVWSDGEAGTRGSFDAAQDAIVRVVDAHPRMVLAAVDGAGGAVNEIGFDYRGRPMNGAAADFNLQPDTCPEGQEMARSLKINASGQMVNHREVCP
ncbi:GspH/FimT family pseudopilin [Luteimonas saliphila]|uniref:GspH/FimT family pseudopilin n=1 Tax=Luteimonas saliphila TaxID=2804919 RepID=UPI00192D5D24|nr:GspH/FimT family pseudopilin [Luteimonas saliphila]